MNFDLSQRLVTYKDVKSNYETMAEGEWDLNRIDLRKSVFEICTAEPEVADILKGLGFTSITEPGMLQTAGRFMTIPKASVMKKIPMQMIIEEFKKKGYELEEI